MFNVKFKKNLLDLLNFALIIVLTIYIIKSSLLSIELNTLAGLLYSGLLIAAKTSKRNLLNTFFKDANSFIYALLRDSIIKPEISFKEDNISTIINFKDLKEPSLKGFKRHARRPKKKVKVHNLLRC